MPIVDALHLSKRFGDRILLDDVQVTIRRGERVGVVGDNGSGKSTLGKILAQVMEPDLGTIHRRRDQRIEYLPQEPILPPDLSALEVVFMGRAEWNAVRQDYDARTLALGENPSSKLIEDQQALGIRFEELGGHAPMIDAERLLSHLGILHPGAHTRTMSGGEKRRVALARTLFSQPDLAILDEPTNHLDAETVEWLEEYLTNSFPGALLLITHDRFLLNTLVDRTLEVENGQVHSYEGGWEQYLEARAERRAQEDRAESNRQNFLRKEIEWLRRQPKARTGKQKARISRAEDAISVQAPKVVTSLQLELDETRLGGTVLEAHDLKVSAGGRTLAQSVNFRLQKGMRVAVIGPSGCGKTTLLRTLLGTHPPDSGEVVRGKTLEVAYLDQLRSGLQEDLSVFDAITEGRPHVTVFGQTIGSYSYLERFRFRGEAVRQKVSALSGGERARVALAKLLLSPANVLVFDEPTNDLDVMTLGALEDLLLSSKGAALFVSHDRYFVDRVATHMLAFEADQQVTFLAGGFSTYAERKRELLRQRAAAQKEEISRKPAATDKAERPKKLTYAEEKELAGLLDRLSAVTDEVRALEQALLEPDLYASRRAEAERVQKDLETRRKDLAELEERWLYLEEKKAQFEAASPTKAG